MRVTILGCGSSGGVPRVGNDWGKCDPHEPKNRRRRCSILVEDRGSRVLVDTSPDLREQLLAAEVKDLDGVVWTHEHADQVHGIDDLRAMVISRGRRIDGYADEPTMEALLRRFGYIFQRRPGSTFPPILNIQLIRGAFRVGAIDILPFDQDHGEMKSLGLRFGNIGYSSDVVGLDDAAREALSGLDVWIVDALRHEPHPSHAHVAMTLGWIAELKPKRAILTNLHHTLDYGALKRELPAGVEPAYDGMVVTA
jgi:phosphoribosyl 1,2-cyclic phosphate phosphodiesterase